MLAELITEVLTKRNIIALDVSGVIENHEMYFTLYQRRSNMAIYSIDNIVSGIFR